jgi:hypothetical protein
VRTENSSNEGVGIPKQKGIAISPKISQEIFSKASSFDPLIPEPRVSKSFR